MADTNVQLTAPSRAPEHPRTKHTCHWPGCPREAPPRLWGCKQHWYRLPKPLRDAIWAAYEPGQEITKTPSARYLVVAEITQAWIAGLIDILPDGRVVARSAGGNPPAPPVPLRTLHSNVTSDR